MFQLLFLAIIRFVKYIYIIKMGSIAIPHDTYGVIKAIKIIILRVVDPPSHFIK